MSKRKILVASGALVLSIAGFFASRAAKYAATVSAYFFNGTATVTLFKAQTGGTSMHLTTVNPTGNKTAFFRTGVSGTPRSLFANSARTIRLYYK